MIEANEDISLKVEQQLRDVEDGQAQAKAIAEGREVHPALLAQPQTAPNLDTPPTAETTAQTLQPELIPSPSDPDATFRHIRLGIVFVIAIILFLIWIRQRKS